MDVEGFEAFLDESGRRNHYTVSFNYTNTPSGYVTNCSLSLV
jgi:hypothetical protein